MKRSLIFLIATVVALNFSCYSMAHPGYGYYIEEPSEPTAKTPDTSASTSSGTYTSKSTTVTSSNNYEIRSTTSASKSNASDDPRAVSEYKNSSQENQSLEQSNPTNRTHKTGNYGFISAIVGLCLVFGLTAFRFPRE